MLLQVDGLRAGYGRTEVLRGVDLRVPEGSAVALLGANGAGKTTLLRSIAGLVPLRHGRILWRGEPVNTMPAHDRAAAGICLIPEGRGIFRRLTVRENLAIQAGRRSVGESVDRAVSLFPKLGERLSQAAGTMSGGEQQMLGLARAVITEPALVMADELSMGLAPVIVDQILVALDALRGQGCSILIVEQYVERAVAMADYVYILHKGEIAFVGEPAQCSSSSVFAQYLGGAA